MLTEELTKNDQETRLNQISKEEMDVNRLMDQGEFKFIQDGQDINKLKIAWIPSKELFDILSELDNYYTVIPLDVDRKLLYTSYDNFEDSFHYIKRLLTYLYQKLTTTSFPTRHEDVNKKFNELLNK